jgi:hypothetical protein
VLSLKNKKNIIAGVVEDEALVEPPRRIAYYIKGIEGITQKWQKTKIGLYMQ